MDPLHAREGGRQRPRLLGDGGLQVRETPGTDETRIHNEGERDQRLVRADVGGGPGTADVLFPGLDREREGGASLRIDRGPHDPARSGAEVLLPAREQPEEGPAERGRDPEPLPLADHHIGTVRSGRLEHRERERVGGDDEGDVAEDPFEIPESLVHMTEPVGKVGEQPEDFVAREGATDGVQLKPAGAQVVRDLLEREARPGRVVREDALFLPRKARGDEEPLALVDAAAEQEGFSCRGRAVIEGRVGDIEARQLDPEALEFEEGAEHPLAGFGLVRRVGSEELAPGKDRVDRRRTVPGRDTASQEARELGERAVPVEDLVNVGDDFRLLQSCGDPDPTDARLLRNVGEQSVDRRDPQGFE